jgi:hypothetical protein
VTTDRLGQRYTPTAATAAGTQYPGRGPIPVAISITFGLALATVWILDLVPTLDQV